jgi:hypothetical protein
MKKLIITIIIAFNFSFMNIDPRNYSFRKPIPIVYSIDNNIIYLRKRTMRRKFIYE